MVLASVSLPDCSATGSGTGEYGTTRSRSNASSSTRRVEGRSGSNGRVLPSATKRLPSTSADRCGSTTTCSCTGRLEMNGTAMLIADTAWRLSLARSSKSTRPFSMTMFDRLKWGVGPSSPDG